MNRPYPLALIALLSTAFLMPITPVLAQQKTEPKAAAIVNGEKIPVADVQSLLRTDRPPVHPLTEAQKKEMWQMAVDMLVNDALMRQFLAKNAPPVSPKQVEDELVELRQALDKKKMTFADFLKETGQTEESLRADILAQLRWRGYLRSKIPDALIKKYYDENKVFFDKVFVKASHILLKFPENATAEQKQAIHAKLMSLRQEIEQGKMSFADAAKQHSDCPSKKDGGDIDYFPYKFAVADAFAKAAFSMKVGEISNPVETEFGYHLIKVTDRTAGEPSNFDTCKEFVRDVYAQEVQLFENIIEEQRKRSQIQVIDVNNNGG